jgi:uncharacterized membrane protein YcaP (DUF421 family)
MDHLIGDIGEVGWIAAKAVLLYLTAVLCLRFGPGRALADLSPFDFVAVAAVGSVVGRLPSASDSSYLDGTATLVAVLVAHGCVSRLRRFPSLAHLLEREPRLLVAHGKVLERELRRCGMTEGDLGALLRQRGVMELGEARYVVLEGRGRVSVIRGGGHGDAEPELVRDMLARVASPGR